MRTPFGIAEVIHLRVENKQNHIARLGREIAELEQQCADLAEQIWLKKLERQGVQDRG